MAAVRALAAAEREACGFRSVPEAAAVSPVLRDLRGYGHLGARPAEDLAAADLAAVQEPAAAGEVAVAGLPPRMPSSAAGQVSPQEPPVTTLPLSSARSSAGGLPFILPS